MPDIIRSLLVPNIRIVNLSQRFHSSRQGRSPVGQKLFPEGRYTVLNNLIRSFADE